MPARPTPTLLPPETLDIAPVRLRTLLNIRWLAVLGQTATVVGAGLMFSLSLQLGLCFLVIGAMVVANLVWTRAHPTSYRLSEGEVLRILLFDIGQMGALLFLTGGLHNPFAILVIGPVTIAATTLSLRGATVVGAVAIATISLLGGYHVPLRTDAGEVLDLPRLHLRGFWAASVIATLLLGAFALRLTLETGRMSKALLATQTALAREQKLHDLGGVVAAAAHELGTPLATIKLVAGELADDLSDPDHAADARLIGSQADRCRDILRGMGSAGKDDTHLHAAPFQTVVDEAAGPHADRGVERGVSVLYDFAAEPGCDARRPRVRRAPELIHGLRNLVQNAVDFARGTVWIVGRWDGEEIRVTIEDDGPGYASDMLAYLGDPFLRSHGERAGYEGMGLGLFIAKTLLERTGARVSFRNGPRSGPDRRGAVVSVTWPRARLEAAELPLEANAPNM